MKVVIYEDHFENFYPLVHLYPQFNLRVGMKTIAENIQYYYPKATVDFVAREAFALKKIKPSTPTIYLSSRLSMTKKFPLARDETQLVADSTVVGFVKYRPPFPHTLTEIEQMKRERRKPQKISGFVLSHLWDLIKYNEPLLRHHFKTMKGKRHTPSKMYVMGMKKNVFVARDAHVHNQVAIDVTEGPVYIDRGAVIHPFSTIIGPSYIGVDTIVNRATITKSSIGPVCRIGGEVEACVFQGYANKNHEGFIGHAFIGEWVNIGALTTNSDLKNNYSAVRVKIGEKEFNSGMTKVGCFIGDHTKTGIGTLIPTGAVIGCFVNFFDGGMMPRYVPCFKWLTAQRVAAYDLEKAIETAKVVMRRRNIKMSKQYENIIRHHYR